MDAKKAEALLVSLRWVRTPTGRAVYAKIGHEKLGRLMAEFGLPGRLPRPGYEVLLHTQSDVKFYVSNKAGRFEVDIHGDVSRVIPAISKKAVSTTPLKSQWAY